MPTTTEILELLRTAANQAMGGAIAWHVALGIVVVMLIAGWRPYVPTAMYISAALLASVAAVALATGNPFNGILYGMLAVLAIVFSVSAPRRPVERGPGWMSALGIAMIAVGWIYPHFLEGPAWLYLIAAPVGVLPCPTLYVITGFTLLGGGLAHRGWTLTFAALALVYGLTGVFQLGVYLDVGLIAGAAGLVVAAARRRARPARPSFPAYPAAGAATRSRP